MDIHPVVAVAHLSAVLHDRDLLLHTTPPPGPVEDSHIDSNGEADDLWEVEAVIDHKPTCKGNKFVIKWKGWGSQYNEWKTERQLHHYTKFITDY
jgi:hypothetical protein